MSIFQVTIWGDYGRMEGKKVFMGVAQIMLDDLELSNIVIGWYKLFGTSSLVSLWISSSRNNKCACVPCWSKNFFELKFYLFIQLLCVVRLIFFSKLCMFLNCFQRVKDKDGEIIGIYLMDKLINDHYEDDFRQE